MFRALLPVAVVAVALMLAAPGAATTPRPSVSAENGNLILYDSFSGRISLQQLLTLISSLNSTVQAQQSTITALQQTLTSSNSANAALINSLNASVIALQQQIVQLNSSIQGAATTTAATTTTTTTTTTAGPSGPVSLRWAVNVGYNLEKGVTTDSNGNIYITGSANGDADGQTSAGGADAYLIKYNSTGGKVWTRLLGSDSSDVGADVATDSSGNVYITGYTSGGLDGQTNAGSSDIFVAKFDASGNKQWSRQIGNGSYEQGISVATDSAGGVYVTGQTNSPYLDGQASPSSNSFLVKYDASGTKQWTRVFNSSGSVYAQAVATDSNNNVFVTGYSYADYLDDQTGISSGDIFVTKFTSSGTRVWTKLYGNSSSDSGNGIAIDSAGNLYIAGDTYSASLYNSTKAGDQDAVLAKLDNNGNLLWLRMLGDVNFDTGNSVAVTPGGSVFVVGVNRVFNGSGYTFKGFVAQYNSTGANIATQFINSTDTSNCYGVATNSGGDVFVAGYTDSPLGSIPASAGSYYFLARFF